MKVLSIFSIIFFIANNITVSAISFPDYFPIDPQVHGIKTFAWTVGQSGDFTSEVTGEKTIPYTNGSITGTTITNVSDFGTLVALNDGTNVKYLGFSDVTLSADSSLGGHPNGWTFGILNDGDIKEFGTVYVLRNDDLSVEELDDNESSLVVDIQDVSVLQGQYNNAVIFWWLDKNKSFKELAFTTILADLGIAPPTTSDTNGFSVTGIEIYGLNTGIIASGDVDGNSGNLVNFSQLKSIATGIQSSIVGSWGVGVDGSDVLSITFYPNGSYIHWETDDPNNDTGFEGVEYGTYTYDPTTKKLVATPIRDDNGDHGLSDFTVGNTETFEINGDVLTITDGDEIFVFQRVTSDTSPIVGSWGIGIDGSDVSSLTFYPNGSYILYEDESDIDGNGFEYGTYTYDTAIGQLRTSVIREDNGSDGLNIEDTNCSCFDPTTTWTVNGNALTIVEKNDDGGTDTAIFQRVTGDISDIEINTSPAIDPISSITIAENTTAITFSLTGITAGNDETQELTVTASSNNTALIPDPTVNYTSPNPTGSLAFTPVANANGTATITITVEDDGGTVNGGSDTVITTFEITVTPIESAVIKVELYQGWNSIALSQLPQDNSIESIFGDRITAVAWTWDNATQRFVVASNIMLNKSYWVFARNDFIGDNAIAIVLP